MNETANSPVKWLKYLLYVGIAAFLTYLLGGFLPETLSRWASHAFSAAVLYPLLRLIPHNARYKKALLFAGAALILNLLGIQSLALAASLCGIVGHFQEYYAHGELGAQVEPALAGKWSILFWIQFAVELAGFLLVNLLIPGGTVSAFAAMGTVAVSLVSVVLRVVYLVYLYRTIKALE